MARKSTQLSPSLTPTLGTGIDSEYWNRFQNQIFIVAMIPIPIPAKNGIITSLIPGRPLRQWGHEEEDGLFRDRGEIQGLRGGGTGP